MLIDIIVPLAIVGGTYLIRYLLKKPLFYDLYGKESKKIANRDTETKCINELIEDAQRLGMNEVKIIADIDEVKHMIQKTKDKSFKIKAITSSKTPGELAEMNVLQNGLLEIRQSETRPMKHFAIIGPHLFIESPHSITTEERTAFVIRFPKCNYYTHFINTFDKCWIKLDRAPPISTESNRVIPSDKSSTAEPYYFSHLTPTSNDH
jgi:hypothetical protein